MSPVRPEMSEAELKLPADPKETTFVGLDGQRISSLYSDLGTGDIPPTFYYLAFFSADRPFKFIGDPKLAYLSIQTFLAT